MRATGTLTYWNDERGFGFIRPDTGGPDLFAHIKAFPAYGMRPCVLQRITFEVEVGKDGKPCARNAEIEGGAGLSPHRRLQTAPPLSVGALSAIPAFLVVCLWLQWKGALPGVAMLGYPLLSMVTLVAYVLDKSAAQSNEWRTPEYFLQLLALAGGWPGAIVAQQFLRHKTSKESFQRRFWFVVAVNVTVFLLICRRY